MPGKSECATNRSVGLLCASSVCGKQQRLTYYAAKQKRSQQRVAVMGEGDSGGREAPSCFSAFLGGFGICRGSIFYFLVPWPLDGESGLSSPGLAGLQRTTFSEGDRGEQVLRRQRSKPELQKSKSRVAG